MADIFYSYYQSPIGKLLMLAENDMLTNLDLELEQTVLNPKWIENNALPLFIQIKQALDRYFNGEKETFSTIPLAPKGTDFQQRIWQALRQIAYGQTASYSSLAELINNPKAVRAVGGAVGSNPISIIIPCHRVLGKSCAIPFVDKGVEYVKQKLLKKYRT